jgi:hypothetical protein
MRALPAAVLASLVCSSPALATIQPWQAGWDNFSEPLNFTTSSVNWSVSSTTKVLKVTFTLNGAKPSKLYQVGFHLFCTAAPAKFGRFPFDGGGGTCVAITRQGKTAGVSAVEFGVILTDGKGNGAVTVSTGAVAAGIYNVEFHARDGAGCNVTGGGDGSTCALDFQSPGPFDTKTRIIVP